MANHNEYMDRCLQLAEKGLGQTGSNPLVGCVIVYNSKIIGEGFHRKFGGPHAEVEAINSVKDLSLLQKSTLYVNLEPCSHTGKTPPCTDMIIKHKIPEVYIGMEDPNLLVSGKGIDKLNNKGCTTHVGFLTKESSFLNRRYLCYVEKHRPYVILKWAESADAYIDVDRDPMDPVGPHWISGPKERMLVHKWRSEEASILVGTNTVIADNPGLNVRNWSGTSPLKLVIDRKMKLNPSLKVFQGDDPCIVFNERQTKHFGSTEYLKIDFSQSIWPQIFTHLHSRNVVSVMVEGGAHTINSLIKENLWDEARVFRGERKFKEGVKAPVLPNTPGQKLKTWNTELYVTYNSIGEP